mmetsp:Transcript_6562/g.13935  ORF Transcript_6562/g.13935 Transcript_6562/m.13935 type:complete len:281 (+) Transcript_6562:243-1085(+)
MDATREIGGTTIVAIRIDDRRAAEAAAAAGLAVAAGAEVGAGGGVDHTTAALPAGAAAVDPGNVRRMAVRNKAAVADPGRGAAVGRTVAAGRGTMEVVDRGGKVGADRAAVDLAGAGGGMEIIMAEGMEVMERPMLKSLEMPERKTVRIRRRMRDMLEIESRDGESVIGTEIDPGVVARGLAENEGGESEEIEMAVEEEVVGLAVGEAVDDIIAIIVEGVLAGTVENGVDLQILPENNLGRGKGTKVAIGRMRETMVRDHPIERVITMEVNLLSSTEEEK